MNKLLLVFLIGGLVLTSCNKSVIDYNSNFEGFWKSVEQPANTSTGIGQSYFIISDAHNEFGLLCNPNCFNCECLKLVEGRAQVNTGRTKLRIGQSNNTVTVTINKEPYEKATGVWVCELDNVEYFKQ